jgi:hypothetical protein
MHMSTATIDAPVSTEAPAIHFSMGHDGLDIDWPGRSLTLRLTFDKGTALALEELAVRTGYDGFQDELAEQVKDDADIARYQALRGKLCDLDEVASAVEVAKLKSEKQQLMDSSGGVPAGALVAKLADINRRLGTAIEQQRLESEAVEELRAKATAAREAATSRLRDMAQSLASRRVQEMVAKLASAQERFIGECGDVLAEMIACHQAPASLSVGGNRWREAYPLLEGPTPE